MKVFCINGMPRSGKDTFCELCAEIIPNTLNISTVDFVKDVAKYCGWDGEKTPHNRKFLSDLKDILTEWDNIPYKDIIKRIDNKKQEMLDAGENSDKLIVFIHVREPKEISKFVISLKAKTILVRRPFVEVQQSNHADRNVFNYQYDYEILNDSTLEDLKIKAAEFLQEIL